MDVTGPKLETLWINDRDDPDDFRAFPYMTSMSRAVAREGDRRRYGNGRLRAYSKRGTTHDWEVTLPNLSRADAEWLEAHADKTLVVRNDRGHRIFATYFTVSFEEHSYNDESDSSLSLVELTDTLEV